MKNKKIVTKIASILMVAAIMSSTLNEPITNISKVVASTIDGTATSTQQVETTTNDASITATSSVEDVTTVVEPETAAEPVAESVPEVVEQPVVEPDTPVEPETPAEPEAPIESEVTPEPVTPVEPETPIEPEVTPETETPVESEVTPETEAPIESEVAPKPEVKKATSRDVGINLLVAPSTPTGLVTSAILDTTATLSWTTTSGATSYDIYLNGVLIKNIANVENVATQKYTFLDLTADTDYTLGVVARNSDGSSGMASTNITTLAESLCVPENNPDGPKFADFEQVPNTNQISFKYSGGQNGIPGGYSALILTLYETEDSKKEQDPIISFDASGLDWSSNSGQHDLLHTGIFTIPEGQMVDFVNRIEDNSGQPIKYIVTYLSNDGSGCQKFASDVDSSPLLHFIPLPPTYTVSSICYNDAINSTRITFTHNYNVYPANSKIVVATRSGTEGSYVYTPVSGGILPRDTAYFDIADPSLTYYIYVDMDGVAPNTYNPDTDPLTSAVTLMPPVIQPTLVDPFTIDVDATGLVTPNFTITNGDDIISSTIKIYSGNVISDATLIDTFSVDYTNLSSITSLLPGSYTAVLEINYGGECGPLTAQAPFTIDVPVAPVVDHANICYPDVETGIESPVIDITIDPNVDYGMAEDMIIAGESFNTLYTLPIASITQPITDTSHGYYVYIDLNNDGNHDEGIDPTSELIILDPAIMQPSLVDDAFTIDVGAAGLITPNFAITNGDDIITSTIYLYNGNVISDENLIDSFVVDYANLDSITSLLPGNYTAVLEIDYGGECGLLTAQDAFTVDVPAAPVVDHGNICYPDVETGIESPVIDITIDPNVDYGMAEDMIIAGESFNTLYTLPIASITQPITDTSHGYYVYIDLNNDGNHDEGIDPTSGLIILDAAIMQPILVDDAFTIDVGEAGLITPNFAITNGDDIITSTIYLYNGDIVSSENLIDSFEVDFANLDSITSLLPGNYTAVLEIDYGGECGLLTAQDPFTVDVPAAPVVNHANICFPDVETGIESPVLDIIIDDTINYGIAENMIVADADYNTIDSLPIASITYPITDTSHGYYVYIDLNNDGDHDEGIDPTSELIILDAAIMQPSLLDDTFSIEVGPAGLITPDFTIINGDDIITSTIHLYSGNVVSSENLIDSFEIDYANLDSITSLLPGNYTAVLEIDYGGECGLLTAQDSFTINVPPMATINPLNICYKDEETNIESSAINFALDPEVDYGDAEKIIISDEEFNTIITLDITTESITQQISYTSGGYYVYVDLNNNAMHDEGIDPTSDLFVLDAPIIQPSLVGDEFTINTNDGGVISPNFALIDGSGIITSEISIYEGEIDSEEDPLYTFDVNPSQLGTLTSLLPGSYTAVLEIDYGGECGVLSRMTTFEIPIPPMGDVSPSNICFEDEEGSMESSAINIKLDPEVDYGAATSIIIADEEYNTINTLEITTEPITQQISYTSGGYYVYIDLNTNGSYDEGIDPTSDLFVLESPIIQPSLVDDVFTINTSDGGIISPDFAVVDGSGIISSKISIYEGEIDSEEIPLYIFDVNPSQLGTLTSLLPGSYTAILDIDYGGECGHLFAETTFAIEEPTYPNPTFMQGEPICTADGEEVILTATNEDEYVDVENAQYILMRMVSSNDGSMMNEQVGDPYLVSETESITLTDPGDYVVYVDIDGDGTPEWDLASEPITFKATIVPTITSFEASVKDNMLTPVYEIDYSGDEELSGTITIIDKSGNEKSYSIADLDNPEPIELVPGEYEVLLTIEYGGCSPVESDVIKVSIPKPVTPPKLVYTGLEANLFDTILLNIREIVLNVVS